MKWLLDPGHGGLAFGHYLTPGKQSPEVPPGIYEGAYNREIAERVIAEAPPALDILNIAPGPIQIPLKARRRLIKRLSRHEPSMALISLHCNAAGSGGWSAAHGYTVFHRRLASANDKRLAEIVERVYGEYTGIHSRGIKKASFGMVRVKCPAVLLEMGFMTNLKEVELLQTEEMKAKITAGIIRSMIEYSEV